MSKWSIDRRTSRDWRDISFRLVSRLVSRFGVAHWGLCEDAVSEAFVAALRTWPIHGLPLDQEAWLTKVARNRALDKLRRQREEPLSDEWAATSDPSPNLVDDEVALLFLCCDPDLPLDSQIALTLKVACGFSVREIAAGLHQTPEAVERRLARAKEKLRSKSLPRVHDLGEEDVARRVESVRQVVSLMFAEGHSQSSGEELINLDTCLGAVSLARRLYATRPDPATAALIATMLLQASRFPARSAPGEGLGAILLRDQDRQKWDRELIDQGIYWFRESLGGDELTVYHAEASVGATLAASAETGEIDWESVLVALHHRQSLAPTVGGQMSIAAAQWAAGKIRQARESLESIPKEIASRYEPMNSALWAEIFAAEGDRDAAVEALDRAISCSANAAERAALMRRRSSISRQ